MLAEVSVLMMNGREEEAELSELLWGTATPSGVEGLFGLGVFLSHFLRAFAKELLR